MAEPLAAALHGVAKHYHGFTLGPLNLEIPAGSIVGLIGENGAGKTTVCGSFISGMLSALLHQLHIPAASQCKRNGVTCYVPVHDIRHE